MTFNTNTRKLSILGFLLMVICSHVQSQSPLPDCQIDEDCVIENRLFCAQVTCVGGFCVNTSTSCPQHELCNEVHRACVECITSSDCSSYYAQNFNRSTCNTISGTCVECTIDEDCSFRSSTYCHSFGTCSNTTHLCISQTTQIHCTEQGSHLQCNDTLASCVDCNVDSDCYTAFSISNTSYCTYQATCSHVNNTCMFRTVFDDVIDGPLYQYVPIGDDLASHFNLRKTPCFNLEQKNRVFDFPLTTCIETLQECHPVECTNNSNCDDSDECNGREICNTTSSTCTFPELHESGCPSNKPYCDTDSKTCIGCQSDLECEPQDPCSGQGKCNITSGLCYLVERCKPIIETCDPSVNKTQILLFYGYSLDEITEIDYYFENNMKIPGNNPEDNSGITIQDKELLPKWKKKLNVNSVIKPSIVTRNNKDIPRDFDLYKLNCVPMFCNNVSDCPLGTLCKVYSPRNGTLKKCVYCSSDADCQDGIKCNGKERCHPEGTCRRAKRELCYNFTSNLDENVTCIELSGECVSLNESKTNDTITSKTVKVEVISQHTKPKPKSHSNKTKGHTIFPVNISHKIGSLQTVKIYTTPSSDTLSTGAIVSLVLLPIVLIIALGLLFWLMYFHGENYTKKHKKAKRR